MSETLLNMTIDETKYMGQETGVLNGCLKAIVLSANRPVHLTIVLSDNPNVVLADVNNFVGDKYLCVRTPCNDYKGDIYNYQVEEFYLNDKLLVQVQGMAGTEVKVKIRMED